MTDNPLESPTLEEIKTGDPEKLKTDYFLERQALITFLGHLGEKMMTSEMAEFKIADEFDAARKPAEEGDSEFAQALRELMQRAHWKRELRD